MSTKTELKLLSRDDILGAQDRATEVVPVPEWGGAVTVRALSGSERDKYQSDFYTLGPNASGGMRITAVNNQNAMARLVALSVVDSEGKRLFTDADVLTLGDRSAIALERVNKIAMRLSGLEPQKLEDLKANLKDSPNGSSGSDSPAT